MEKHHRKPVVVHEHPHGAVPQCLPGHAGAGVAHLLPDGRGVGNLLQLVPEQPLPQPSAKRGEPADGHIQGRLQNLGVHLLFQGSGEAEGVGPVVAPGRRIDFGGVVQRHPPELVLLADMRLRKWLMVS